MLLSKKVLDEYKRRFNSDLQVEKDTRVALREQAIFFGLSVQVASRAAKDKAKRKAFKLSDVVNGAVTVLKALQSTDKPAEWINDVFKTNVDVGGHGLYAESAFTELVVSGLFTKEPGSSTISIDYFNSLRISEVENMLKTPRKASRNTNAFLAKAITKYIFYLIQQGEAQANSEKKKRITRQHLKIVPVTAELSEAYAKFNAGKGAADETDDDGDADPAAAKKSVSISPTDQVHIMPAPGPEYSVAPGPTPKVETTPAADSSNAEPPAKKPKKAKPVEPQPVEPQPVEPKPVEPKPVEPKPEKAVAATPRKVTKAKATKAAEAK
jgi:hypothetical protein